MSLSGVRSLMQKTPRQKALDEAIEYANRQRATFRCRCGWYVRDILVADGKRAFQAHLTGAKHTGHNRKHGPQAKTRDRLAGMSWSK